MSISAPFRFVRIARKVHEPGWGPLATHDIPFADGLSGQITVHLTTITPLLIGGERTKDDQGRTVVHPHRVGGRFAIPPSSMQGMCRSILEIAGFGRIGTHMDDRRYGIRDLGTTMTGEVHYRKRLSAPAGGNRFRPKTRAGYLVKGKDDEITIIPCSMARIHIDRVIDMRNGRLRRAGRPEEDRDHHRLKKKADADKRYRWFLERIGGLGALAGRFDIQPPDWHPHRNHDIRIEYRCCTPSNAPGAKDGMLVLTGKQSSGTGLGRKKWEFVFYDRRPERVMAVEPEVWEAFEFLHEEQPGRPRNPNWDFWKGEFVAGRRVPVFYWEKPGGGVDTFGMAYAFKAAHTQSTKALLKHSHPDHATDIDKAGLDLASLIFGTAAEGNQGRGLKRRAWFSTGFSETDANATNLGPAILLAPKPSFAGIYVRQFQNGDAVPENKPLATYSPATGFGPGVKNPELAGVKIWPCSFGAPDVPEMPGLGDLADSYKIQNVLNAVPQGTTFTIPLSFHNLRPAELGALLWALSWGEAAAFTGMNRLHHRLGMGKPLGLGEVALKLELELDGGDQTPADLMGKFTDHMDEVYKAWGGPGWAESKQIKALLKAADPAQNEADELRYMELGNPQHPVEGTYIGEKNRQGFLRDYVEGHEFDRPPAGGGGGANTAGGAGPAPQAGPQGSGANSAAEPDPVKGARVWFPENRPPQVAGKEGEIIEAGNGDHARHKIRLDNGRVVSWPKSMFTVLSVPD